MSAIYPSEIYRAGRKPLLAEHDRLKPFLLAVAILVMLAAVALAVISLPR